MTLATADDLPPGALSEAFRRAFAAYPVPVRAEPDAFAELLAARGAEPGLTFVERAGDEVRAFAAFARSADGREGYLVVSGVVPKARRRGLARALCAHGLARLAELGCRRARLEVLAANAPAAALYAELGFRCERELVGLRLERPPRAQEGRERQDPLAPGEPDSGELAAALAWQGARPAWQNDRETLERRRARLVGARAGPAGAPLAVGLVDPRTGDVPLLAVAPEERGRGLGGALLARLAAACEGRALAFANLDPVAGAEGVAWLARRGAREVWRQHELVRDLGA